MAKKKKAAEGFAVGPCSVCERVKLTLGWHDWGGIRYCRDCFRLTLAWVQIGEDGQQGVIAAFQEMGKNPRVLALLEAYEGLPAEKRKEVERNMSIGESSYRLMQANVREARGY